MRDGEGRRRRRFDELFAAHSRDVAAYCSWRSGSPSDAQDAVAEVFLTAWRRLDAVPVGDAERVWLYATARRRKVKEFSHEPSDVQAPGRQRMYGFLR